MRLKIKQSPRRSYRRYVEITSLFTVFLATSETKWASPRLMPNALIAETKQFVLLPKPIFFSWKIGRSLCKFEKRCHSDWITKSLNHDSRGSGSPGRDHVNPRCYSMFMPDDVCKMKMNTDKGIFKCLLASLFKRVRPSIGPHVR